MYNSYKNSIIACSTFSLKSLNEDFSVFLKDDKKNLVVVADGMGSFYKSNEASKFVCEYIKEQFIEGGKYCDYSLFDFENFNDLTEQTQAALVDNFTEILQNGDVDKNKAFGTTAIMAVESDKYFDLAYLGNGGLIYLGGDFNHFPAYSPQYQLPWTMTNLLKPHSTFQNGKNAMHKFISYNALPEQLVPSYIRIRKDKELYGDIVILCTDGIHSLDEITMGQDNNKKWWISGEEALMILFSHLKSFFADNELWDSRALENTIDNYLLELNEKNLVTDDCTIGIIISERTLMYQKKLKS